MRRRAALDTKRVQLQPLSGNARTELPARRVKLSTAALVAVGVGLVCVIASSVFWSAALRESEAKLAAAEPAFLAVEDEVDPMQTKCRNDEVLAASETWMDGKVQVQMMYSTSCMAGWGRVTRYDGKAAGNTIGMRVYPKGDPQSSRAQERSAEDVQSVYTTLMLEPDVDARVCGAGGRRLRTRGAGTPGVCRPLGGLSGSAR